MTKSRRFLRQRLLDALQSENEANALEITRQLHEAGEDFSSIKGSTHPLYEAIEYRQFQSVRFMLANGADVNAFTSSAISKPNQGRPIFHLLFNDSASQLGLLKHFLDRGADLRLRDHKGRGPLAFAFRGYPKASLNALKMLIDHGADVNERDLENYTPLHWACSRGELAPVDLLINAGADINARSHIDETPFYMAVSMSDSMEVCERMISAGADIHQTRCVVDSGDARMSPLLHALFNNKPSMAALMMLHGATLNDSERADVLKASNFPKPVKQILDAPQKLHLAVITGRPSLVLDRLAEGDDPAASHASCPDAVTLAKLGQREDLAGLIQSSVARRSLDTLLQSRHGAAP